jgi:tetratricopeptide (TPR) repeat protein
MQISHEAIQPFTELYLRGLYLQALEKGQRQFGPIREWEGPDGRMLASRLAVNLGAPRLSLWHRLKAWRETPEHPEVRYYYGWTLFERQGPWHTWKFIQSTDEMPHASPDVRSSWYSLGAQTLSLLRDFERADQWLRRALDLGGDRPWVHVVRSGVLELEDRYDEALDAADSALKLIPYFRPAVQSRAHLLTLMGRDEDAFHFLQEAGRHIESSAVYWHLASIHFERDEFAQLKECLQKFEEYSPLLEGYVAKSFHNLRSFLAYQDGDDEAAIMWARKSIDKVMHKVADRLEDPARKERKRVILPVGFVRQHHMTCVPATLTTISRYWNRKAEHLQVADEICYNGTTAHAERKWAEENGWATQDFTVTEDATTRLIDNGVPFTLTTTDVGGGHLQAVIGYDGRRGSIVIRDPYVRNKREMFIDGLQEDYGVFGPRGMAMVPREQAAKLNGQPLPDAELWDETHELDGALIAHQREIAARIYEDMSRRAPDHLLTIHAQRRLAVYDANSTEHLAAVEKLLVHQPDNAVMQLTRLSLMRHVSTRAERLDALKKLADKPDGHPAFQSMYAQELSADAREHDLAIETLKTAIRRHPTDPGNYHVYAGILWSRQEFNEALELYRFAACLDDKDELLAENYFSAAQHCRQTNEVLKWLRRRFEQFGAKSSLPARTLEWALKTLQRTKESLEVLDRALELRPDDGELALYVAGVLAGTSTDYSQRAHQLLQQAKGHCQETYWLRTAARIAILEGDRATALELYRQVLDAQPMATDAHQTVAQLLSELEGEEAAVRHLRQTIESFPHHQPLLMLCIEWLRNEPPETVEPIIRRLIELNPADAWAIRELGFFLLKQRRYEEAEACAAQAQRLDPKHNAIHHLRGELFAAAGRMPEARREYREALKLGIDNEYALSSLLRCCDTPSERREELKFIREELVSQVIYGDGLLAWRNLAHNELEPQEVLSSLREALEERPDLWHAWSAIVNELLAMNQLEEAALRASEATEKFPLLPRLWLDRATVARYQGNLAQEEQSLEVAYRINPAWGEALRQLSDLYLRKGDFEKARSILEGAVARDPLDAANRGGLADVLWKLGEKEQAVLQLEKAVDLAPGYSWAWGALDDWCEQLGQPGRSIDAVRTLVEKRPGEARSWLMLARILDKEYADERFQALDKAIELNPRSIDAYSQKSRLLFEKGEVEAALAACKPAIWKDQPPAELLARAAWIRWECGEQEAAITEMLRAVQQDPTLYSGWQSLADWSRERRDAAGYLKYSEEMMRLEPFGEVSLGYFGDALMVNDKRDTAKEVFQRAYEIEPAYDYAGMHLYDMQIEDGEWEAAAKTVATLERHTPGPYVFARQVQIAAHDRNLPAATAALRKTLTNAPPQHDESPLNHAYKAMSEAGWLDEADAVISDTVLQPDCVVEVGHLWASAKQSLGKWEAESQIRSLLEANPPVGQRALYMWMKGLIDDGHPDRFRTFVRINEPWLRADDHCWGSVNFAWAHARDWKNALPWAQDWKKHSEAQPWMLVNTSEIFRATGRNQDGAQVNQHALSGTRDHSAHLHELWLAIDAAFSSRLDEAADRLTRVDPSTLDDDYFLLFLLVRGMVDVSAAAPRERGGVLANFKKHLNEFLKTYQNLPTEPARRQALKQALGYLSGLGGPGFKLWAWWKQKRL